jgi:XTP/dITP diphosphohydrolase
MLRLMSGENDRMAEFRSAVAYCEPGGKPVLFKEKVGGVIAFGVRGKMGFGFDPIFIPNEGDGRTFAEMSTNEKNKLSHRGRAMEKLFKWYLKKRAKR